MLAFADAEIIQLATNDYVAVACDDWYQRRRQDAEGEYFRQVANQGPRKGRGGSTRQGIYCFTADGKLLAFRNHQSPEVMRDVLRQGLKEWKKLPEESRKPGAVVVPALGKVDPQFSRKPPAGGLILNVSTRILDEDKAGGWCKGTCKSEGGDRAARDHMWLTAAETRSLVPAGAKQGQKVRVPDAMLRRLMRFHLVDNTRGEPPHWTSDEIREQAFTCTVAEASADHVLLRLEGKCVLASGKDQAQASRGYDAALLGYIGYDRKNKTIDRFQIIALGNHWGEGTYTGNARAGRHPLGVAFDLAKGNAMGEQVPPQAARDIQGYLSSR